MSRKPRATARPPSSRKDVWEHFEIKALSPSQLQKFAQDAGLWYASARAKVYEDAGPAAWRGDAIEAAMYAHLMGRAHAADEMRAAALAAFNVRFEEHLKGTQGELSPEMEAEVAKAVLEIDAALPRVKAACADLGLPAPLAYQVNVEAWLPSVRVPVRGKPDFCLELAVPLPIPVRESNEGAPSCDYVAAGERMTLDLKTTRQLPTEPKPEHAIAASLYAIARGEAFAAILYISTADKPKIPHRLFVLDADSIRRYVFAAQATAIRLEMLLKSALIMSRYQRRDKEELLAKLCTPNLLARGGGTYDIWKSDYSARARAAVPAWR